jgi:hypothetical protein
MTPLAFFSPSLPELIMVALSLAWWIGIPYMLWLLLKRQKAATAGPFRGEGIFTEAIVGDDGVLRVDVPLGSRWAGRPVRVVVESAGPL